MAGGDRLSEAWATNRDVPAFLHPPGPSAFHRLNPLTKATLATVTAVAAVVLGGLVGPAVLVVVAVIGPALAARVFGRLIRTALLLSLPIAVSAVLINLFFFPGCGSARSPPPPRGSPSRWRSWSASSPSAARSRSST